MKRIFVVNSGRYTKVDDKNYMRIACHSIWDTNGGLQIKINGKSISLPKYILNDIDSPFEIDHIGRNYYNNLEANFRPSTRAQNCQNRCGNGGISKFKGVSWCKRRNKWYARITVAGNVIWLGYFDSEVKAARVYNAAALKFHGEFARLNDI